PPRPVDVERARPTEAKTEMQQQERPARRVVSVEVGEEQAFQPGRVEPVAVHGSHRGRAEIHEERPTARAIEPDRLGATATVVERRPRSEKPDHGRQGASGSAEYNPRLAGRVSPPR